MTSKLMLNTLIPCIILNVLLRAFVMTSNLFFLFTVLLHWILLVYWLNCRRRRWRQPESHFGVMIILLWLSLRGRAHWLFLHHHKSKLRVILNALPTILLLLRTSSRRCALLVVPKDCVSAVAPSGAVITTSLRNVWEDPESTKMNRGRPWISPCKLKAFGEAEPTAAATERCIITWDTVGEGGSELSTSSWSGNISRSSCTRLICTNSAHL